MLQSIQYVGSGPPTYIYSKKAVGASGEYYHVFAAETRGYDGRREHGEKEEPCREENQEDVKYEADAEKEEFKVLDTGKRQNLQEVYKKEYGRRESFLWRQK